MKLIAKIAIPLLAIIALLASCSSSPTDQDLAKELASHIECPITPEQIKQDAEDQPEIESIREAVRTGKPNALMIKDNVTVKQAAFMLDIYDESMKKCK